MASVSSLGLPRPFGPYELVRQLAVGGMAEVFVARARSVAGFEKIVALKMIHPQFSEDPEFARLLVEEANITAQLSHRNIVQVIDLGQVDGSHYIAMEYVDGMDLSRLLAKMRERGQKCSPRFAAFVTREVCDGLEHAHRKTGTDGKPMKIVHRDVSPPNILISTAGEVKLTDFGIAKAALRANSTEAGVVKGKYAYMPPEQARGQPLDLRADVFSAGCVLYELATGQPVYKDGPLPALLDHVARASFEAPEKVRPDLPPALVATIKKALSASPQGRYASARAMADDLNGFLYTLPPNPEFEVSQIVSGISESARASIPPMAGMSLFDDDEDVSTQIESMASMRSKIASGDPAAAKAAPKGTVPLDRAPDPEAFADEPTRAMRRDKLIPDLGPEDDEPEPTVAGARPNTAAPRVGGGLAPEPQGPTGAPTARIPAAGVRSGSGAPKPAGAPPAPVARAAPAPPPAPAASLAATATAISRPGAGALPTRAPDPKLPARKATLIGVNAMPAVAAVQTAPAAPARRSMPPAPPSPASRPAGAGAVPAGRPPALPQMASAPPVATPALPSRPLPSNVQPAAAASAQPGPFRAPTHPPAPSPSPGAQGPSAAFAPQASPPPAAANLPEAFAPPAPPPQYAPQQPQPPQPPQPPQYVPQQQQQQSAPGAGPQGQFPGAFGPAPTTPQGHAPPGAPTATYVAAQPPPPSAPQPLPGAHSDEDRKERRAVIIAGVFAVIGVAALLAVLFTGR
ncbi:MAG: protein kinase [Deltaproteobacteria bacterium]